MSDDLTIDPQAIAALRELSPDAGGDFLRELIEIYLQDTPQRLAELDEALSKQDHSGLTRAAHTIKGSSSNFGAIKLSRISHEIEMQGKSGDLSAVPSSVNRLKAEYALVAEALAGLAKGA